MLNKRNNNSKMEVPQALHNKLIKKLQQYRAYDRKKQRINTITYDEAIELISKYKFCKGCGCKLLFYNYKPQCYYQFIFHRRDNKQGFTKNNIDVTCFWCSSVEYNSIKQDCHKKCHIEKDYVDKYIGMGDQSKINPNYKYYYD